nr:hypothetical protein [Tanacetum cinerariifolium]
TLDPLGKFDGKTDEGFLVGYSVNSKALRVFNSRTRIVQETLHIKILENQRNVAGSGPKWLFDIDTLTQSMNYQPVVAGNQPNHSAGSKENFDADHQNIYVDTAFDGKDNESEVHVSSSSSDKTKKLDEKAKKEAKGKSHVDLSTGVRDLRDEFEEFYVNNNNRVNAASEPVTAVGPNPTNSTNSFNAASPSHSVGHTQKEGIDYEEVFAPISRIESIWLFLVYASFMGFMVYQMDVKSAFLYGTIKEEVYVCQPSGFEDPDCLDKVYKLVKALHGLHQAPRAWSMIGSLMYLTSSRPDIMFAVYACARFQVTLKVSHLHAVKKNFRYLKGKPYLGLWYPKASSFTLVAYSDSDYAGASLGRNSTTGGCQFLTVVDTSSTEAEYVAAASCCAQVLWIQNQLLDYRHFISAVSYKLMLFGLTKDVVYLMLLDDLSSHITKYTSPALTQKVFANMRRIGKGFSGIETPLFDTMLVQPQVHDDAEVDVEDEDDNEKVAHLEQDKVAQALENVKLKHRVKKLEKKRRSKSFGLKRLKKVGWKIEELDVDEDVTLVDVDTIVEMDLDIQGRVEEDVTAVKEIYVVEREPTVFNDEEVTMTMAQTLIKMKAEKARILDEHMAKKLQDEEIEQAATREKQEKGYLETAKVLQQQYDQSKKILIGMLYKIQHFKGMTYDQVRPIFESEYNNFQTFLKSDKDEKPTKKRVAKETMLHESFKKLRTKVEVSVAEFKVEALQVKYPLIDWKSILKDQELTRELLELVESHKHTGAL